MLRLDPQDVVQRIASVLPKRRPIEHHETDLSYPSIRSYVEDAIEDNKYSYVREFEARLIKATGIQQALAVSSGTAALHLALMAVGVKPGDGVLVPTLTFVGTANAVVHAGAVPIFVDGTHNLNAFKLRCFLSRETEATESRRGRLHKATGRVIRALIVVHLLGIPADMDALSKVADSFGLTVIEDAAEALGTQGIGKHSAATILSFNQNKIITTGGGGAVLTNDPWTLSRVYQLATTARVPHPWLVEHDEVAWNYRMPSLCAALGLGQMDYLDELIAKKKQLAEKYESVLDGCPGITFVKAPPTANHWLTAILCDYPDERDVLLEALHAEGIKARAMFTPLHKLPMYKDSPRDALQYAINTAHRMVCLPSGANLANNPA